MYFLHIVGTDIFLDFSLENLPFSRFKYFELILNMKDSERNPGCELGKLHMYFNVYNIHSHAMSLHFLITVDLGWLNKVAVNLNGVNNLAKSFAAKELKNEYRAAWILKAITLIDLTTLGGDDTESNVSRLCFKVPDDFISSLCSNQGFFLT